ELDDESVRALSKPAVAEAMRAGVVRILQPDGGGRRAPQFSTVLVAQVDSLARPVAHRVVAPWRERVLTAVARPGEAGAVGRHLETEAAVRYDVDPGRRRRHAAGAGDHVFAALRAKPAEAVEKLEPARRLGIRRRGPGKRRSPRQSRCARGSGLDAFDLVGEAAASPGQH